MSLVKMKRLFAISAQQTCPGLLAELRKLGCVEVEEGLPLSDLPLMGIHCDSGAQASLAALENALSLIAAQAPQKKSFLAPKRTVQSAALYDAARLARALDAAAEINGLWERHQAAKEEIVKLEAYLQSLSPWLRLDVPLNCTGTGRAPLVLGTIPAQIGLEAVGAALDATEAPYHLEHAGSDGDRHYLALMYYHRDQAFLLEALKPLGFSTMPFPNICATARAESEAALGKLDELKQDMSRLMRQVVAFAPQRAQLEDAIDAFSQHAACDRLLENLACTEKTVLITGWLPEEARERVEAVLEAQGCAYSLEDPQKGDSPPTAIKSGKLADPLGAITEMYGMPGYDSLIDPNPFMLPFYVTFFGFIMADLGYGLMLMLGTGLMLMLKKPTGTMKKMLTLFFYCGITTSVVGLLTGSFFADAVAAFSSSFLGMTVTLPVIWFDPLTEPMTFLLISVALGAIQVLVSMGIGAGRQIMRKDYLGALFDCGTWYMVFLGGGLYLGLPLLAPGAPALLAQMGLYICLLGVALMLILGAIIGKGLGRLTKGLGQAYNVVAIFSDILSYSRIMALALSGAVVGQVFNRMGTMGRGPVGILLFVVAFVVGHVFNLLIGGLGAYVHTSRLHYIEFFGRFYESGGRPFRPMVIKTKYTDII